MKIGSVNLPSPRGCADGRHDGHRVSPPRQAPRRLRPRRHRDGEREGRARIDRALDAEYRKRAPISVQIFGGDPDKMAGRADRRGHGRRHVDARRLPVPRSRNAGCSLMRERDTPRSDCGDDRGGEDSGDGEDARRLERRRTKRRRSRGWSRTRAPPPSPSGRTAAELQRIGGLGSRRADCRPASIRFRQRRLPGGSGSGSPSHRRDGVLVGRGVLRNPWILAQSADLVAARAARVTLEDRGRFLSISIC